LERQKAAGAVAEKFEAAYLRALDFGDPSRDDAERVFKLQTPTDADYKLLQDYIFRHIARECGRLGMAVHFHVQGVAGGYFNVAGANPMNLEPLLNDPGLRKTNFVFIHGGWPFDHEITALLSKPNAYLDFSQQTFTNYPRNVAESIRRWLEWAPEKVMFATDAYPFSAEMGWEEAGWVGADSGRTALALALTGMMADGEITRARALELARMVLRDNARKLYGLTLK
jgi:predicted TIM-barrel fold metal-dependent hydrolase